MAKKRKPLGHWNKKSNCKEAASKCKTRTAFFQKAGGAYLAARRNGWLDSICRHMD